MRGPLTTVDGGGGFVVVLVLLFLEVLLEDGLTPRLLFVLLPLLFFLSYPAGNRAEVQPG